jgi:ribosomal protein L37AE/L43A
MTEDVDVECHHCNEKEIHRKYDGELWRSTVCSHCGERYIPFDDTGESTEWSLKSKPRR